MSLFGCDHAPLIAQLRADLAAADAALVTERRRYDELLQTVLAMKAKGAEVVPVADSVVVPAPAKPIETDELKVLIHERCGTNVGMRAMMLRQLAVDRAADVPEDQIRKAIAEGVSSDGVPA